MQDTQAQVALARQLMPYVPRWLVEVLSNNTVEPGYAHTLEATVFYADLSGFTPLTEALSERGPQGVEALNQILNTVFGTIVETLHAFDGDVVEFSGDAITAFWPQVDRNTVLQAVGAAQVIQVAMQRFNPINTPAGDLPLMLRMGIGVGQTTLLIVGNDQQCYCVLSGTALLEATTAEGLAHENQIVLSENARATLEKTVAYSAEGMMEKMLETIPPRPPKPLPFTLPERLKPFIPHLLVERLQQGQGAFLADFRHAVALLFVSFTADTSAEVQTYVSAALTCIAQHGGYLSEVEIGNKGNVLVVLFGAPLSLGDNGPRAAACALELAKLPGTQAVGGSTGPVLSGVIGGRNRRQYTVAGTEVILSARLMMAAHNASHRPAVLLSNRIVKQTQRRFAYGDIQWLQVKGRTEPVAACYLLGPATHSLNGTAYLGDMPLIGRAYELNQIKTAVERARNGQGQVLLISGEMGIGKSRLSAMLLHEWQTLRGHAYGAVAQPATQTLPYVPWASILRALLGIKTKDATMADQLVVVFKANAPRWLPRLPLLKEVIGVNLPDTPQTMHLTPAQWLQGEHYFTCELLRAHAQAQPLLLILEDLQWMDAASWGLTLTLAQMLHTWPVLLCLTHRPQAAITLPDYAKLSAMAHSVTLPLAPLSPEELRLFIRTRLGIEQVSSELFSLVQTNTQGHPYFTEELLNALNDQELLTLHDGIASLDPKGRPLRLPDTIRGAIQTQLDDLDEATRFTLKIASVIGQRIPYTLLQHVHPMHPADDDLKAQLNTLIERKILRLESPTNPPVYTFCNAIMQEVIYSTLAFAQRRVLHGSIEELTARD